MNNFLFKYLLFFNINKNSIIFKISKLKTNYANIYNYKLK